ncbi:MAG: hypothetical protein DI586_00805 [Micavibrio aeruginosavorus]|uniref:Uncharacterized protein n=1 Tax=Micavibrio aeruginosavorus TaxID=349221 RepID=A0A2W5HP53_9BACT|nr:MAG: hypothetical protein DI586_00805 [Micavibrio aeruginosavorus]
MTECDAVNFQTNETARRFMTYMGIKNPPQLDAYTEARFDTGERELSIGHYPISIDTQDIKRKASGKLVSAAAQEIAEKLTAPIKFTNFERADYSKGIEPRLLAYERLLQNHPEYAGQTQIVIGAEPTRNDIEEYRHYAERIREIAARINEHKEWYHNGNPPVILVYKQLPHADLIKLLPDTICTVTPYRDGMNLVSKEFVAAQDPNKSGVLILSSGAGSAAELTMGGEGAVVYDPDGRKLNSAGTGWVNPRTPDEGTEYIYRAMIEAIQMPQSERNRRCARMQAHLDTHDIGLWSRKHAELLGNLARNNEPDMRIGPDFEPGLRPS